EANPDAIVETPDAPAGETPVGDAPAAPAPVTEPPAAETEPDVSVARARAILKAARETEEAAKAREANFTSTVATRLRSNPKALLAELGLTIDEVIDASIAEGAVAAPAAVDPIAELRARLDAREAAEDQRRLDEAITKTKDAVKADSRFPTVNAKGHQGLVVDFMIEYHAQHGKPIPWDKAAALIEADLAPPAAPAKPAANVAVPTPTPRPGTQTLTARDSTNYVPPAGDLPEDPDKLLKLLVSQLPD
ncbi:MAG TPA: hypothetical protein VN449_11100, partial [Gaiellaceae bacterium]|nr:hypothetical protein [Gaiellaceae bacterium]